jgi:hypothetical protein
MKLLVPLLLAATIAATASAEPTLPPPDPPQQARQVPLPPPPQHLQPPAPQAQQPEQPKRAGKPPEYFKARREALAARKQAQIDRMMQVRAARAAADQKAYEDWHERYLADTPVREQYYRAQANAYLYDAAYYNYWGPPVVYVPVIPIYYVPHDYIYWPW